MGSIVLHDVEPYSIVAGVPANPIRKRFNDRIIKELIELQWWNRPLAWLRENVNSFIDPELLLVELKK